jgi:hypothetical protein
MQLSFVFNRTKNFFLNPKPEWQTIQSETHTRETVLKNYAIPIITFMVICSILGSFMMVSKFWYTCVKAIGLFAFTYAGLYISAIIINEVTSSFNARKDLNTTFKLVIYSSTASFFMSALVLLWPPLALFSVFGLYSVYLYWIGASVLLDIPKDDKLGFVVVSCLIITGIYTILWLILEGILFTVFAVSILK